MCCKIPFPNSGKDIPTKRAAFRSPGVETVNVSKGPGAVLASSKVALLCNVVASLVICCLYPLVGMACYVLIPVPTGCSPR